MSGAYNAEDVKADASHSLIRLNLTSGLESLSLWLIRFFSVNHLVSGAYRAEDSVLLPLVFSVANLLIQ